jgi:hypothetical protein
VSHPASRAIDPGFGDNLPARQELAGIAGHSCRIALI